MSERESGGGGQKRTGENVQIKSKRMETHEQREMSRNWWRKRAGGL